MTHTHAPRQLLTHQVRHVAAFPGSPDWIAEGATPEELETGRLGGAVRTVQFAAGSRPEHSGIAMLGLDATRIALCDGASAGVYSFAPESATLALQQRLELPGELGWYASLAATASGDTIVVASDRRLGVFGAATKCIDDGSSGTEKTFWSPVVLPGEKRIAVGRGDGRVEIRDLKTLRLRATHRPVQEPILAACVVDEHQIAIASDDGRTGLLDIKSGAFRPLDLESMKTSGLHRLAEGRFCVVSLSRRIRIFEDARCTHALDLSEALGDRYIQKSALGPDGTLLLACEQRGLYEVKLDELPAGAAASGDLVVTLEVPGPPSSGVQEFFVNPKAGILMAVLKGALADGRMDSVTNVIDQLVQFEDDVSLQSSFIMFVQQKAPMAHLAEYLKSPLARVRYYAADYYGQLPELHAQRATELERVLHDTDPEVVGAAVWSLGRIGDRAAIPWIAPLLRHAAEYVRATAVPALVALRGGAEELTAAIREGQGDITLGLLLALWPQLTPQLSTFLPEETMAGLKAGLPTEELVKAIGVSASDAFLALHAGERHTLEKPRASGGQVVYELGMANRWPATFENSTVTLASPDEAATWWQAELQRRFSAGS